MFMKALDLLILRLSSAEKFVSLSWKIHELS